MHFDYMEAIASPIMDAVLGLAAEYAGKNYGAADVKAALGRDALGFDDFGALLSVAAEAHLEEMANRAKKETGKHFGNAVSLYTPLYLSNYCVNHCVYCGFNCGNAIARGRLSDEEMDAELRAIARTGLREVLLLTGEDRERSDIEYIGGAVKLAAGHFSTVGLEVYPLNTDEYAYMRQCGADFVSVYQETYDPGLYEKLHLSGPKRVYAYRFDAQERAVRGGMRGVSFGALLGLGDFRRDVFSAGAHAFCLQQRYPHAEISFSAPRLRAYKNNAHIGPAGVGERQLLQAILAYRLFMPYASIAISTRERAGFRDNVIGLAATKISAGVKTSVGGHIEKKGDEQFEVSDTRSVPQIHAAILAKGLQPVYADYIRMTDMA